MKTVADKSGKASVISLGDNFGRIVVEGAGIKLELDSDGWALLYHNDKVVYVIEAVYVTNNGVAPARPVSIEERPVLDEPEQPEPEPEAAAGPEIGEFVEGKGVYAGTWEPKDGDGNSLGKVFNLYAAPEDITDIYGDKMLLTFNKAVKHVAGMRDYHGHNGGEFANEAALYEAIRAGRYNGEWFIPTKDVLIGNLYGNRNAFKPENAFVTSGSGNSQWYWSCRGGRGRLAKVWNKRFTSGTGWWDFKCTRRQSTRPVRAEELDPSV